MRVAVCRRFCLCRMCVVIKAGRFLCRIVSGWCGWLTSANAPWRAIVRDWRGLQRVWTPAATISAPMRAGGGFLRVGQGRGNPSLRASWAALWPHDYARRKCTTIMMMIPPNPDASRFRNSARSCSCTHLISASAWRFQRWRVCLSKSVMRSACSAIIRFAFANG